MPPTGHHAGALGAGPDSEQRESVHLPVSGDPLCGGCGLSLGRELAWTVCPALGTKILNGQHGAARLTSLSRETTSRPLAPGQRWWEARFGWQGQGSGLPSLATGPGGRWALWFPRPPMHRQLSSVAWAWGGGCAPQLGGKIRTTPEPRLRDGMRSHLGQRGAGAGSSPLSPALSELSHAQHHLNP